MLETDRLILRKFEERDSEFVLELMNDPDWIRFIGDRGIKSIDDAIDCINSRLIAGYKQFGFGMYVVELKADQTPVGMCGLVDRESVEGVDLGFAMLKKCRGLGYARESSVAVIEYAATELKLPELSAITMPENDTAIRLLTKLEFEFKCMTTLEGDPQPLRLYIKPLGS